MNYHNITTDDMLNGDGLRTVLWVAGCSHHCPGCQNPITWDATGGIPFDDIAKKELFDDLKEDYIAGLTLSGGDPLYEDNLETIDTLIDEFHHTFSSSKKTIWLYTGYTWNRLMNDPTLAKRKAIVSKVDVVVEGPYIEEQRDVSLHWRGSANQRVIDVKQSLQQKEPILFCK